MAWAFAQGITSTPVTSLWEWYENIPDLSVTFVLDQAGPVSAWMSMTLYASTSQQTILTALQLDGGAQVGEQSRRLGGTILREVACPLYAWPNLAAGTHTIRGRWAWGGGSGDRAEGIDNQRYLLVEY